MTDPQVSHDTSHNMTGGHTESHDTFHAPELQGQPIPLLEGTFLGDVVTQTVFTTWLFMLVLFFFVFLVHHHIKTGKRSKIRVFFESLIAFMQNSFDSFLGNKHFAKQNFFIIGTLLFFICFGNLFGLLVEVLFAFVEPIYPQIHSYLRPINSDLNTTLFLALVTIILTQYYHIQSRGIFVHITGYLFNFRGTSIAGRFSNVFFGWLHLIGEVARIVSLSFRLFGNVFAGMVLIIVMTWLSTKYFGAPVGATIPFFLFEIFVALFQGFIFTLLTLIYLKESQSEGSH